MKQWIREHPWRLEIVPAVMALLALCEPLILRTQLIAEQQRPLDHPWDTHPDWRAWSVPTALMVWFWLEQLQNNQDWVQAERDRKRFNNSAVLTGFLLGTCGLWGASHLLPASDALWLPVAWIILFLAAWPVQTCLEQTRRFIRKETESNADSCIAPASVEPRDRFYYRETQTRWGSLLGRLGCAAYWPMSMCWYGGIYWTYGLLAGAAVLGFALVTVRATFVVSRERVSARVGYRRVSIPIESIESCELVDVPPRYYNNFFGHPYRSFRELNGIPLYALSSKVGPSLRIVTRARKTVHDEPTDPKAKVAILNEVKITRGRAVVFGMNKPQIACALINSAIAARENKGKQP